MITSTLICDNVTIVYYISEQITEQFLTTNTTTYSVYITEKHFYEVNFGRSQMAQNNYEFSDLWRSKKTDLFNFTTTINCNFSINLFQIIGIFSGPGSSSVKILSFASAWSIRPRMSNFLLLIFSLTCIYFLQQCFTHNFHKMLLSVLMIHFTTGFIFWKKKPIWYYSLLNEISFRHLARPKFQFFNSDSSLWVVFFLHSFHW